ncbi:response regulator [Cohnella endophytica]|uniref:Response regulator n=1 Tax=Cohnella endophytica TaxID=2419778 RepID=A0A494YDN9_9BACL|nr:response regulator [Cohnella endophytica]RKP58135.1 response regulator [Cohnella endophytica]
MRNVMIVDDESLVRIGLQSMIDWERFGFRIAGVFKNGEEMLAAAAGQHIDVVLTDIRMPGMDGFELIRELRKTNPDIHVIVLSSYNDFEYTRQAIRLGVKDYISKYEMEPDELVRVLESLPYGKKRIVDETSSEIRADGMKSEMAREARALLDGRSSGVSRDPERKPRFPLLTERLGEFGNAFRWICLMPYPRSEDYSSSERKAMSLLAEEMFDRLSNPILFGESDGNLHAGYACRLESGDAEGREECFRMAEEWTAAFSQKLNVSLAVGFGAPTALDGVWMDARRDSEQEAEDSLFDGIISFRDNSKSRGVFTEEEWLGLYKQIKQRIRYIQIRPLADDLIALQEEKLESYKPSEWIRLGVAAASQLADFLIERYDLRTGELGQRFGALWPFAEAAGSVRTAEQWRKRLRDLSARTQDTVADRQARGGWLERVKEHLESHFGETIRLEEMALLSNFSENHFSQRFRQETGQAFSDYLTDLRIREAVRLFRDTELSTEEIAFRVGYSNPNYFVKVFKKKTGQTVKNFKSAK